MNKDELYHWGIKGMRWGVRRKQQTADETVDARAKKKGWHDDATKAAKLKTKKTSQMSNKELKELNTRQELESNHRRLNPSSIKKGLAIAAGVAAAMGTVLTLINHGKQFANLGKQASKKYSNMKSNAFWKDMKKPVKTDLSKTTFEDFMK